MVTIVDEAFLAGKKFARTYTQTMENTAAMKPQTNTDDIIDSLKFNVGAKKMDITYKENAKTNAQIVDNKQTVDNKIDLPHSVKSVVDVEDEIIKEELRKLLCDNKISQILYNKLTSNKHFELEPQDIEFINKLDDGKLKVFLLKYQSGKFYKRPNE